MSSIIERLYFWYQEKLGSFRGWINLENATSYRSPIPEGIVSIFLFIALTSIIPLEILGGNISRTLEYLTFRTYAQGAFSIAMTMVFVAPMFLSNTFVRSFSDGTMKTYLSYPISRFKIMVLKIYLPTIFLGFSASIPLVLSIHIAFMGTTHLDVVLLYSTALWVTTILVVGVTSIIAVTTKNVIATSFTSMATSYSLSVLGLMSYKSPYIIQGTLNPVHIVSSYFGGVLNPDITPPPPTSLDVFGSFIGAISIGIGLLVLALIVFRMREV